MNQRYNGSLKSFAQLNRKRGTKGEAILWAELLKSKKMEGFLFNRQFIIGNYIVDFICRRLKLIIELDGQSHKSNGEADLLRQKYLENKGYKLVRLEESDILKDIKTVENVIRNAVLTLSSEE